MIVAIAYSRAQLGISAPLVRIETHLTNGLPAFNLVGLPETAVRESKERVRSAILSSGFEFPTRRITVNLAPGDLPKEGTRYDLAIALGILAASVQIPHEPLAEFEAVAELALTGELRHVRGVMPAARACQLASRSLIVAPDNVLEATRVRNIRVLPAPTLSALCSHLKQTKLLTWATATPSSERPALTNRLCLSEVRGQYFAKRALEIAAAGGHNILFYGPPGTGKTMLATRLAHLLAPLDDEEAYEVAAIHSIAGVQRAEEHWLVRPFRAPHHTSSAPALVGGGSTPRPGEASLAHRGILFLDELPEFGRRVLDVLREPLETGHVTISRAAGTVDFPATFQLVAAMNPCPCGYHGDPGASCRCTPEQVRHYHARVSGPLLDRIDIQIEVARERNWLSSAVTAGLESSASVRERTLAARVRQWARQGKINHHLSVSELTIHAPLDRPTEQFLAHAFEHYRLNPRTYHRLMKLARTIADVAECPRISQDHLTEALALRRLEVAPAWPTGTKA